MFERLSNKLFKLYLLTIRYILLNHSEEVIKIL